jgi:hypothetical protein
VDGQQKVGPLYVAAQNFKNTKIFIPELTRFFGIIIRMYVEFHVPHHEPHFHVYHQDDVAIYSINPIELIAGSLPKRQKRLVEAWAEIHQQELLTDWELLQAGKLPKKIEPLR